jgi:SWIM zinc finger
MTNKELDKLLWKAARATTAADYHEMIKQMRTISVACVNYLEKTADKKHWAEAFFDGNHYGHLTSNIAESFNNWILEARDKPILGLLKAMRVQLMDRMVERHRVAELEDGKVIFTIKREIQNTVNQYSRFYVLRQSTNDIWEVLSSIRDGHGKPRRTYIVDIPKHHCTCNRWQKSGVPCGHGLAAILRLRLNPHDYVDQWFTADAYRGTYRMPLLPIPDRSQWRPEKLDDTEEEGDDDDESENDCLPPNTRRPPGRPKTRRDCRKPDAKAYKCGTCGQSGHYRSTCSEAF